LIYSYKYYYYYYFPIFTTVAIIVYDSNSDSHEKYSVYIFKTNMKDQQ